MILKCAITEDEPLALGLLESYVNKTPVLELAGKYRSAVEALAGLKENPVDLLFLDIQMPELDGLEFSRMIPASTRIVFTTAFGSYALEGYKVNALDYLLKPISYPEFIRSVNKALEWFGIARKASDSPAPDRPDLIRDCIYVKSEYKLVRIPFDSIRYIEGLKDYVKFYTASSDSPILSLMSMKNLEELLPKDRFIRVHRSFIIRIAGIKAIDRNRIIMDGANIPIGDTYRDVLQKLVGTIYIYRTCVVLLLMMKSRL